MTLYSNSVKMNFFRPAYSFILIFAFSVVFCDKERIDDQNLEQITDELLHEIEKRLNAYNGPPELQNEGPACSTATNTSNTIIKTQESLDAGAVFLDSPDSTSENQCRLHCCRNKDCNLAVFKNKEGETSCYMFDCGNPSVCEFVEHLGFTVFKIPNRKTSKTGVIHEEDLEHLAAPSTTTSSTTTTTTTTTTTKPPTTTTVTAERKQVSLYGKCSDDDECADSYAECLTNYCMCKTGYTYQESVCKTGSDVQVPDSTNQKIHDEHKTNGGNLEEPPITPTDPPKKAVVVESTTRSSSTDSVRSTVSTPQSTTTHASNTTSQIHHNTNVTHTNKTVASGNAQDGDSKLNDHSQDDDSDFIEVEKIVVQSNKGAIVALSLGLIITFMLLVFVGCRLRNIRKRLKHGRPMNSNEADYLINGMYL